MAALISCFLSLLKNTRPPVFQHAFGLNFPPIIHETLEEDLIKNFEEVFVIGDVHGCYDELMKLFENADAVNDKVLKIFVGDLVNKGPKNKEVLDLLQNSSTMLSVRGNHDEVVLREYFNSQNSDYQLSENNLWIKNLSKKNINYLNNLPYTISIPSLNVIIVHAGLVPGTPLNCNDPEKMVTMRNLLFGDYFWGKGLYPINSTAKGEPWASLWPGPYHIYFGHDAKRMLQTYPYATGLDTGCVYGNWLTGIFIYGPRKGTLIKVDAMKVHKPPTVTLKK